MELSIKDWLNMITLRYDKGYPILLQHILADDEIKVLTEHIEKLVEYQLETAISQRDENMQQMQLF